MLVIIELFALPYILYVQTMFVCGDILYSNQVLNRTARSAALPYRKHGCRRMPAPMRSLCTNYDFCFFGRSEQGPHQIKYVFSQQCGAQARTLRTQYAGELGTFHTERAQTVGAHAHADHTISEGFWHVLHLRFDRLFSFIMRDVIDRSLPALNLGG